MMKGTWLPGDLTEETSTEVMAKLMGALAEAGDWKSVSAEDDEMTYTTTACTTDQLIAGLDQLYECFKAADGDGDPGSMARLAGAVAQIARLVCALCENAERQRRGLN